MRLDAIVLGAGAGRRFGGGKLLATLAGRPLIEHALKAAFEAPVRSVLLVTGADAGVGPVALAWADAHDKRLLLVHAADHADGMSASLRAGLAALPPDSEGAYVFLGDMPHVPIKGLQPLADALAAGALAAAPQHGGRRGHPALVGAALYRAAMAVTGDAGARAVLDGLGDSLALLPTGDAGVLFDIDTRDNLERS